jgi:TM2 domain-containing membrane protein YozV
MRGIDYDFCKGGTAVYSKIIAYLLWFLSGFGVLGFHRFYLGKPLSAILWICTGGLFGIGSLYDLFTLGFQVDQANAMFSTRYTAPGGGADRRYADNETNWRYVYDGSSRVIHEKDSLDVTILKIARRKNGVVSPSEVVLETGVSLEEARKHLESMVIDGHAEMRVRKSGAIVFTFSEFMDAGTDFEFI